MNVYVMWVIICAFLNHVSGVSLNFAAIIDLETWSPQYRIPRHKIVPHNIHAKKIARYKKAHENNVTKPYTILNKVNISEFYVENNSFINQFKLHVYEEGLKLLRKIKLLYGDADKDIKIKVDLLEGIYKRMFGDFLYKTKTQNPSKDERVIQNIIESAKKFLQNLLYDLGGGKYDTFINNEINKLEDLEKSHICNKFKICGDNQGLTNYALAVLGELKLFSNEKLMHAVHTATDILKYADYSRVLDKKMQTKFREFINKTENMRPSELRSMIFVLKNILNKEDISDTLYFNTTSIQKSNISIELPHLIDIINNNLPKKEKYIEWEQIKSKINGFWFGQSVYNPDVMAEAITNLVNCFKEAFDNVDDVTAKQINEIAGKLLDG